MSRIVTLAPLFIKALLINVHEVAVTGLPSSSLSIIELAGVSTFDGYLAKG
jgi:hypothetical protein